MELRLRKIQNYNEKVLMKRSARKAREILIKSRRSISKKPQIEIKRFRAELKFSIVRSLKKHGKTNRRVLSIKIGTSLFNYFKSYNIGKIFILYL